jgi:hypothetical protein
MNMSDPTPPKAEGFFKNPQVVVSVIGGIVTILVAIVGIIPNLVQNQPAPPTVVVVTATPLVETAPTDAPVQPTFTPISTAQPPTPTLVSLNMVVTLADEPPPITAQGNVSLMYDSDSFTLLNQGTQVLSLEGVTFRSASGLWEARDWGVSIYTSISAGKCVRLRDATVGNRQPPAPCRDNIYGLQLVGTSALFWVNVDSFEVLRGGEVIATCEISAGSCLVSL